MAVDFSVPDIPDYAYPSDVLSEAQRERWRLSRAMATLISAENEPSGKANSQFVLMFSRTLYESEIPTGSEADPMPDLVEGAVVGSMAEYEEMFGTALEEAQVGMLLAELAKHAPADDADEDANWEHVGRVCDVLDKLLGTPDDIDGVLGDHVGRLAEGELVEAFGGVAAGRYDAKMHPRDRAGRWARTLHAIKSFARANSDKVAQHLGRKMKRVSDDSDGKDRARLRARAAASKAARVAKGAAQETVYAKRRSQIHAVNTLAAIYSPRAEEKLGVAHENVRDPLATLETVERAKATREALHKAADWAVEHHEELNTVLKVARHAGGALGLMGGDDDPVDGPGLEEAELLVEDLVAVESESC